MTIGLIGFYLACCAILAFVGRYTAIGSIGVFFVALIFTPILVAMGLLLLRRVPKKKQA